MTTNQPTEVHALVVLTDGTAEFKYVKPDLTTLQGIVGGYVEVIQPQTSAFGNWHAYVNEEGKSQGLAPNDTASVIAARLGWAGLMQGDYLVGNVIFLGEGPGETEEDGMSGEGDFPDEATAFCVRMSGEREAKPVPWHGNPHRRQK